MRMVLFGVVLSVALLAGCSLTKVNMAHSLVQGDPEGAYAKVYFIRPHTEHPLGFADNALAVLVDGEALVSLVRGEYTLVYLKPRRVNVTLRNFTQTRGRWELEEMERSAPFTFESGQTYFVLARAMDGEFRGAHFWPEAIDMVAAKQLSRHLKAADRAANEPIGNL